MLVRCFRWQFLSLKPKDHHKDSLHQTQGKMAVIHHAGKRSHMSGRDASMLCLSEALRWQRLLWRQWCSWLNVMNVDNEDSREHRRKQIELTWTLEWFQRSIVLQRFKDDKEIRFVHWGVCCSHFNEGWKGCNVCWMWNLASWVLSESCSYLENEQDFSQSHDQSHLLSWRIKKHEDRVQRLNQDDNKHEQLKEVNEQEGSSFPTRRSMFWSILHTVVVAVHKLIGGEIPSLNNEKPDKPWMPRTERLVEHRSCAKESKPRGPIELSGLKLQNMRTNCQLPRYEETNKKC